MITKKDALNVGIAICNAVKKEVQNYEGQRPLIYAARGTGVEAMTNVWHTLSDKVKAEFNFDMQSFSRACGWE